MVVAGDVDVKKVRALAEKYYGSLPARAVPARKPRVEPEQRGLRRIAVKAPAEQAYVALAFRAPSLRRVDNLTDADRDALALRGATPPDMPATPEKIWRALESAPAKH